MAKYESKKGIYQLEHPEKYKGPLTENGVLYRSTWEQRVYYYMDHNKNIIEWGAESIVIPYLFKLDGQIHKYYPDIVCKVNTKDGIKTYIIEIKPEKQTMEPKKPKNRSLSVKKKYEESLYTYAKNTSKWEAAEEFCKKNNYVFKIITEKQIFA